MKTWTFNEMSNKVLSDLDLLDETFIELPELVGYFNEAIDEAEAEINTLPLFHYFKKFAFLNVISGQRNYALPNDIYINKMLRIMYTNGSVIYPIVHFRPRYEYEDQAFSEFYGSPDDYRFQLINSSPGQVRAYFTPVSRETAINPPNYAYPDQVNPDFGGTFPNLFTPVKIWYQRNAQRMPIPSFNNIQGELRFTESLVGSLAGSAFSSVNVGANQISTVCGLVHNDGITPFVPGEGLYALGDILYFTPEPGATLPAPLAANTPYFVIPVGAGIIQLATSLANAQNNIPLVLTTTGSGFIDVQLVTTPQNLGNLLIDIPQFATFVMQWVKCRCLEKDGDPRLPGAAQILEQQRKQMNDTLAEMLPDLDNEIEPDFSHYQEMS